MPKELLPSSYLCDCGHQSDFFENTIREAKAMSHKRMIHLGDSEPNEHTIVFYKGQMIDILCPDRAPDAHASPGRDSTQVKRTTVSSKGSVVIPAAWRKRYGIVPGSFVDLEDRSGEIVIRLRSPAYKQARGMLSEGPSLTADLLAERARERERELVQEALFLYESGAGSLGYVAERVGLPLRVLMEKAREYGITPQRDQRFEDQDLERRPRR